MAKAGNRSTGPKHVIEGICVDCGDIDAPKTILARYSTTGKCKFVKVCLDCAPKV